MLPTRRRQLALLSTLALAAAAPAAADAKDRGPGRGHGGPTPQGPVTRPATIALPNGFSPEGVASSDRGFLFAGSLSSGAVLRADPRTGQGAVLVPPQAGRISQGLKVAGDTLVVAGGTTGHAYLYDARTGANLADLTLTTGDSTINDVAIGKHEAWFTDSRQPQLYRVTLGKGDDHLKRGPEGKRDDHGKHRSGGKGDDRGRQESPGKRSGKVTKPTVSTLPITGDLAYDADPATFEANGIVVLPGGKALLVVQSRTGKLFRVDAATGVSEEVVLAGGATLPNGDGLLLKGNRLYVVQNRLNQIAVVKLDAGALSGAVERTITSPLFRVPTTVARIGGDLFAVNARFGTPSTPGTDYDIVRVPAN